MRITIEAMLVAMLVAACSSAPSAPSCTEYVSSASLAAPTVSFQTDVLPIFAKSCGFSTCHGGRPTDSNEGIYLGGTSGGGDPALIRANLLATSKTIAMPFVTPSDPKKSFLMRKMDGDTCTLDAQCKGGSCGTSMPSGAPLLDAGARDVVRRWIAQGALAN